MTDPDTANRTYIGPMTPELIEGIIAKVSCPCLLLLVVHWVADLSRSLSQEKPDALLPTMGGQTALNLAVALAEARVPLVR